MKTTLRIFTSIAAGFALLACFFFFVLWSCPIPQSLMDTWLKPQTSKGESEPSTIDLERVDYTFELKLNSQIQNYISCPFWLFDDPHEVAPATMFSKLFQKLESEGKYFLPDTISTVIPIGETLTDKPVEGFEKRFSHYWLNGESNYDDRARVLENALTDMILSSGYIEDELNEALKVTKILENPAGFQSLKNGKSDGKIKEEDLREFAGLMGQAIKTFWANEKLILISFSSDGSEPHEWADSLSEVEHSFEVAEEARAAFKVSLESTDSALGQWLAAVIWVLFLIFSVSVGFYGLRKERLEGLPNPNEQ